MASSRLGDTADIRSLLAGGENERVEFKRGLPRVPDLIRIVASLANTKGGYILIGVGEDGRVHGAPVDADALNRLALSLQGQVDPPIDVTISTRMVDDREIVLIEVPRGRDTPYVVGSTAEAYVRVGATTQPARHSDLQRLALEAQFNSVEDAPVTTATLADLDPDHFEQYLMRRGTSPSRRTSTREQHGMLLQNLGFATRLTTTDDDSLIPTVAGLLLFGRAPQQFLPQARVDLIRFAGDQPGSVVERAILDGTLPEQLSASMEFLERNMRVALRVEGFRRNEVPEYPVEAVRELVVNALIHRDYGQRGRPVQIFMFFDRWEITSPGRLPGALLPDAVQQRPERLTRNSRIAESMRVLGHVEGIGLGLAEVRDQLETAGLPPISIVESATSVTVTLRGAGTVHQHGERLRQYRSRLVRHGGNPRQLLVLQHLLTSPSITNAEYRRLTKVSEATALRDLTELVEHGLLARHGASRGVHYTLVAGDAGRTEP